MQPIFYARHQFPPEIIRHAMSLYLRFTLSHGDMEEALAQRGLEVSYEIVRRWVLKFGPAFACNLRRRRLGPAGTRHLHEMVIAIQTRRMYRWRAVDTESEILDVLVQFRHDKATALRRLRNPLKKQRFAPSAPVTDKLPSFGAARRKTGGAAYHERGLQTNSRVDNSHQLVRRGERRMQGFKAAGSTQRVLSIHAAVYNNLNFQRHLQFCQTLGRFTAAATNQWQNAMVAAGSGAA